MESSLAIPQERAQTKLISWLIWGLSSLFICYQMLLQVAPSVMISDLGKAFSIDTLGVSLLSTGFFYPYVLLQIPAGMLADRVSPRICLTLCLIGLATTLAIFACAHTLQVARISRIAQGMFAAPSVVIALTVASMWFPKKYFALLAGMSEMIGLCGSALGQGLLAPIASYWGWRSTLFCYALLGFAMAFCTWAIIRNKANPAENPTLPPKHETHILRSLLVVISCPQAWLIGLYAGLLFAISAAFGAFWCIPYLMEIYGLTLNTAAAASSMILFGVALGAPVIGGISDRINLRRLPMLVSTALVLILMVTILYVHITNIVILFSLLFALGFFSGVYVIPYAVIRDIMPGHVRGTALGYTNMMGILIGAPMLQPLIGWILKWETLHAASSYQAYQSALAVLPISLAMGFILAFFIRETHCKDKI